MKCEKLYLIPCLLLALSACTKEEMVDVVPPTTHAVCFGAQDIVQTRIAYGDQENDGISATFETGDTLGAYVFYNNFYYYFPEYFSFAESVLLANQWLAVDDTQSTLNYSPIKSWTFSTLYGNPPHTLDAIAYYPFRAGYNLDYVYLTHSYSDANGYGGGAATLQYNYAGEVTDPNTGITTTDVHANVDFMTAHERYDYSSGAPGDFREAMLGKDLIPFTFTRQTASFNLKVVKPEWRGTTTVIKAIEVHFYAYKRFTQKVDGSRKTEWTDMVDRATEEPLVAAVSGIDVTLQKNTWNSKPTAGAAIVVPNLLADDQKLFFPPETSIQKIVFTILDGDGDAAVTKTYVWHPHIPVIESNKHYTINLELDPARAN